MHQARLNTLLLLLMLASAGGCATGTGHTSAPDPTLCGTLPEVSIKCGEEKEVYRNRTRAAITVTIQATDNCDPFDSTITLEVPDGEDQEQEVENGGTSTVSFSVPPGGILKFDCSGSDGTGCKYSISVP